MPDVHIIGGGPAGSSSALSAVRNGLDVTISEEHKEAGVPTHCSGLFSKDGLNSLSDFLDYRKLIINPINGAVVHLGTEELIIRRKDPIAFVCDRAELDATILRNAENEGAKVNFGERIEKVEDLKAQNVIGADGPVSYTASAFNFPKMQKFAATLQAHLPYRSEDRSLVEVFVNNELFPGFFGWIIPHDEETAEFGCGVVWPGNLRKSFDNLLEIKGIGKIDQKLLKGCMIPIQVRRKTSMKSGKRKILLVGDAAGQTKATTGGGVIFGGNCGREAGKFADNPFQYELNWRRRYLPDLAIHQNVHRFLGSQSVSQLSAFGGFLKNLKIDSYLSSHGHMDKPSKMISPALIRHLISLPFCK
ncbi:NAD(P)/FAD-dependent oxidoreductase [Candidatus Micrarchaeota archaeon]|nr:NAD(P)/FAD-dependent oxidoreductase [Candidatus Micrarchaeota archaeon]